MHSALVAAHLTEPQMDLTVMDSDPGSSEPVCYRLLWYINTGFASTLVVHPIPMAQLLRKYIPAGAASERAQLRPSLRLAAAVHWAGSPGGSTACGCRCGPRPCKGTPPQPDPAGADAPWLQNQPSWRAAGCSASGTPVWAALSCTNAPAAHRRVLTAEV